MIDTSPLGSRDKVATDREVAVQIAMLRNEIERLRIQMREAELRTIPTMDQIFDQFYYKFMAMFMVFTVLVLLVSGW